MNIQATLNNPRCRTLRSSTSQTFLDSFPFTLAEAATWLSCGALVDGASATPAFTLRHVRCHLHVAAPATKFVGRRSPFTGIHAVELRRQVPQDIGLRVAFQHPTNE